MKWGKITIINLYKCKPKLIRDKGVIKKFIKELCRIIDMKRCGKCEIKRFGKNELKGYSAFQFIETSSITLHFDETKNRAFIDIFSCKDFNSKKAGKFSAEFFKAEKSKVKTIMRK